MSTRREEEAALLGKLLAELNMCLLHREDMQPDEFDETCERIREEYLSLHAGGELGLPGDCCFTILEQEQEQETQRPAEESATTQHHLQHV